jgi:hypothetical protein
MLYFTAAYRPAIQDRNGGDLSARPDNASATDARRALAAALRQLHGDAGKPSSRKVAAAIGSVSHTTIADALAGRRVPSWFTLEEMVLHLQGDVVSFRRLWEEANAPASDPLGPSQVVPPYPHRAGAGSAVARTRNSDLERFGSMGTGLGSTSIGSLEYHRRAEVAGQPVRLAPRPMSLAGRESLLADLDARLADGPGPQLVALCGLGGTGKTSVAVEYAHRHLDEMWVCWQFAAEDPGILAAEFGVLAAQLGARETSDPRDSVTSVHTLLARAEASWLVVFDNAPSRAAVERFVPPAGPGRVVITTQNQHWPPGQALEVPVLDLEVAADFLVNRTGDPDRMAARELATEMGALPLALEQGAAYIQATATPLAQYLPLFRDRQADLLKRGEAAGHPAHVSATLELALYRLAEEAPAAAGLMRLLAFLAPEPVPLTLLLASRKAAARLSSKVTAEVVSLLGDPIEAGDAIAALRCHSLITPAGDGLVLVHRLVRAVSRQSADEPAQWKQAAAALLEEAVPADPKLPAAWPAYAVLLPHAQAVLDLTSESMWKIAQYLGYSGTYPAARDLFQLIADARAENDTWGPEHPVTLAACRELAHWTGAAGDADGARDLLAGLLPLHERVLGTEHPDTLTIRASLSGQTEDSG